MKTIQLALGIMSLLVVSCKEKKEQSAFTFTKPAENPILRADSLPVFFDPIKRDSVHWQKADVFNPAAIIRNDKVMMLYRAEDNPAASLGGRTSRIGLAESEDGIHFTLHPVPVLYPDSSAFLIYEYPGGCEDPRIVQTESGNYVLTYTAWNGKTARLSVATSTDLLSWKKHGPVFLNAGQKWLDTWSKSGAIVCELKNGNPQAIKINNKYWMFWGDTDVFLAWSNDLVNWIPVTDAVETLVKIASPRKGFFDSGIAEPGPPALLTKEGVRLIYNGKNHDKSEMSDTAFGTGMYGAGYILVDPNNLTRVIERSGKPFLYPTLPHEKTGQYQSGTTFAEAYVEYKGKKFLYYGTADSFVGVAVSN
ncbi:MAG: glycoside hydrolase family 130 protein [Bacteroidota bacterium]